MTGTGRVALVTGANRGLGYALCQQLSALGMDVFLSGRDPELVEQATTNLRSAGCGVHGLVADVTDSGSVDAAVAEVVAQRGRIDVLINNAGVVGDAGQRAAHPDFDRVQRIMDTNLMGAWRCISAVTPHMLAAGYGRIVNVSSHLASSTTPGAYGGVSYRVSKAALNALTRVLAAELAGSGVLVNAASPGKVNTRIALAGAQTVEPDQAAADLLWLATLPEDGPTGGFWHGRDPLPW
ncbi:SDR family NAD(P)-dependent oxidoreductase [Catellatospora sp. NPDC049133]|uniref:SDR family NAD(P)-dependent oxidoreductase n=1 Tax=Catellatospora sp. NPDC049133 TaxID=3155499 RepID=UPI0033D53EBE